MIKLRLDLNALEVDSFQTSWLDTRVGTVRGEQDNITGAATECGGVHTCGEGCRPTAGGATHCGGIETCGDGCRLTGGGATKCGGIETCGEGGQLTAGGATKCGGIETCGDGCKE
jgi:hypothetical protein